jgi:general secretion pathway protein E
MGPLSKATISRDPRFASIGLKAGDLVGEPVGCDRCNGVGYRGRLGVFEILEVTEQVSRMIGKQADDLSIERQAQQDGMTTMIEDGVAKCKAGLTSVEEILRVIASR